MNVERIEKGKDEYLKQLNVKELESYIDNLIQNYYENCLKNDVISSKENIKDLNQMSNLFKNEYPFINHYINQKFIIIGNTVLKTSFFNEVVYNPRTEISLGDQPNDVALENLFDDDLMRKILVEENLCNIYEFMNLLSDMNTGIKIRKSFTMTDNKIPRFLYDEILKLLGKIKDGDYDNIENLDDEFLTDDNPYELIGLKKVH